jgi:hypothetical protein
MVDLLMQRGEHNIEHELIFSNYSGYIFHDSRGFEAGGEDELKIVQNFVGRRSQERRLEERLHVIWFVPSFFGYLRYNFGYLGTASRWTIVGRSWT